jgi:SAM-dependent methyltransferase
MDNASLASARNYYGRVIENARDLRTDACATAEPPSLLLRAALANVHPEVRARYYGCGLIAPARLEGARVLDLGSGAGQDAYVLAQLVGERGAVVGVDATPEQLAHARAHLDWHRTRFGYARSNVEFLEGDIGQLEALDLAPASFDVIVSNCVFNLLADKPAVFAAAYRLLKHGGELYFSDIYADRRLSAALAADQVLHGECLAGALYWNDFVRIARAAGFADPRLVTSRPLQITDDAIAAKLAPARFYSATFRLFKLDGLESACEDYGQAVRYNGGVAGEEAVFTLDAHHVIEAGRIVPVCGNTYAMLRETRFAPHFDFFGDGRTHFGIFKGCETEVPFADADALDGAAASACC